MGKERRRRERNFSCESSHSSPHPTLKLDHRRGDWIKNQFSTLLPLSTRRTAKYEIFLLPSTTTHQFPTFDFYFWQFSLDQISKKVFTYIVRERNEHLGLMMDAQNWPKFTATSIALFPALASFLKAIKFVFFIFRFLFKEGGENSNVFPQPVLSPLFRKDEN